MEWPMLAKGGCVGSGLEDALTWQEEEGGGAEGPFSGAVSPGPFGLPERKAAPRPQGLPCTSQPVPWVYF